MSRDYDAPPSNSTVPTLLRLYLPVMLLSALVPVLLLAVFVLLDPVCCVLPAALGLLSGLHILYFLSLTSSRYRRGKDYFELSVNFDLKHRLHEFAVDIAKRWNMPRPDEVRLSALTSAHVYETRKGKRILVVGGTAIAALSQEALGAIIAHELSHFEAGDTAFDWENLAGWRMMHCLGHELRHAYAHWFDPAIWPLAAFHFWVELQYAKRSRDAECRADAVSARHAGAPAAAAALIYHHLVDQMEWADLGTLVEHFVNIDHPTGEVFTEQARRAASTHPDDWVDLLRDELRKRTKPFDQHPCLYDRLEAIGAHPDEGLDYLLDDESPPARRLIKDWPAIERKLSVKLTSLYQMIRGERYIPV